MANEIITLSSNQDIDYIVKDYDSATDAMISFATTNYGSGTDRNRLWTNFNKSSFSRTWLELVAYVADILYFYLDQQATQSYLQTATIRSAVKDIAAQFGFTPATASSASGNVTFTLNAAGVIPRGFKLVSTSGVPFYLTNQIIAGSAGEYTGTVLQGEIKTESFVSQGLQNEEFNLIGPVVLVDSDNTNPADISPIVEVTGNDYTLVSSFLRFNGTDSDAIEDSLGNVIGGGGRVFILSERPTGTPYIKFGDGIFGRKLVPGEVVSTTYRTGGGSQGNIEPNSIVGVDSLPFISSLTNTSKFSGGADEQTIEQLRELIPASLRTLERAVAESDYSDLIVANFNEVFTASTEVNTQDPGIDLNIYVVPQGSGITKITDNSLLLTRINNFVDRRKMVTIQFQVLDAFGVEALIGLEVFINDTASKSSVSSAIQTALTNFFDLNTGGSDGSGVGFAEQLLLKDIYDLISTIDGVSRVEIKRLSYRPRIDFRVQGLVTEYNATDVNIFKNVSESEWLVAASGSVTETEGSLIFGNSKPENFSYNPTTGLITYAFPVDLQGVGPGDLFRNGPGLEEEILIKTTGDGTGAFEVTEITTKADQQGIEEVTEVTTVADVAANLGGTYFIIYDIAGSVAVWFNVDSGNTQPSSGANRYIEVAISEDDSAADVATALHTAMDADAEFASTVATDVVTITSARKLDLFDAADGSIPTNFLIEVTIQGQNPDTLSGAWFDIYDTAGPVRVWFDVDNTSTAPATPGGGRLLQVDIVANDSGVAVATALNTVMNADAQFASTRLNNVVTVTDAVVGARTNVADGTIGTGFEFDVTTQGANPVTIDGTYFIIYDINGAIAYWYDVDNGGTPEPAHGAPRSVEISTVTSGMTAAQVATQTRNAIAAGIAERSTVVCSADISGSLNDKYFLLNSANDATEYYVWYNVAAGGTDPALAGKTGIEVAISTNANANAVATATQAAINADAGADFTATDLSGTVTITNDTGGATTSIADAVSPNGTGFTFAVTRQGTTFATSVTSNEITVTANDKAVLSDPDEATSGFTITVELQGVEDDTDFFIFAVDVANSTITILPNQPVNPIAGVNAGGSIRNGNTAYQSFKVFKKLNATATNLANDTITDSNIDLSVLNGTGSVLSARMLIDNSQVFVPNEYATGNFYLVDAAGNIWDIDGNESNTILTSITAVNDAAITTVSAGPYKIVEKLIGSQVVFNGSVFNVQYNNSNTLFSVGAQFTQIGTIGDQFQISQVQSNIGDIGVSVDLVSFNAPTGQVRLNGSPDLLGISSGNILIDSSGQTFSIVGVDNRALPQVFYSESNQSDELILAGSGLGSQYAQGFQVPSTDVYSVISFNLKREGNIIGNLSARIVGDDGTGLPDISNVIAISNSVNTSTVSDTTYEKINFSFTAPPTLTANIQYHMILVADAAYAGSQQDGITIFNNTGSVAYTYTSLSGVIQYVSNVTLSSVAPGNFFEDNDGTLFKILSVDDTNNTLTLASGLPVIVGANGNVLAKDNIYLAVDDNSPSYADGELSRFNGAVWSNSTLGPDPFPALTVAVFTAEGPKSIQIESNLTPILGPGATISTRYYDDENEISFALGLANGSITSATDVNAVAKGTVGGVPDTTVDNFVFRTSRYADDVINLRKNEIPVLEVSDIDLQIFGGIE